MPVTSPFYDALQAGKLQHTVSDVAEYDVQCTVKSEDYYSSEKSFSHISTSFLITKLFVLGSL